MFDVELIAVMDDLLDRGDYDDGDVSDLRLDLREAASTRAASTGRLLTACCCLPAPCYSLRSTRYALRPAHFSPLTTQAEREAQAAAIAAGEREAPGSVDAKGLKVPAQRRANPNPNPNPDPDPNPSPNPDPDPNPNPNPSPNPEPHPHPHPNPNQVPAQRRAETELEAKRRQLKELGLSNALQHRQSASLGSAPARLLRLFRARLAALGSSALAGSGRPTGAQPLPRVLELAASKAADVPAFDHAGAV